MERGAVSRKAESWAEGDCKGRGDGDSSRRTVPGGTTAGGVAGMDGAGEGAAWLAGGGRGALEGERGSCGGAETRREGGREAEKTGEGVSEGEGGGTAEEERGALGRGERGGGGVERREEEGAGAGAEGAAGSRTGRSSGEGGKTGKEDGEGGWGVEERDSECGREKRERREAGDGELSARAVWKRRMASGEGAEDWGGEWRVRNSSGRDRGASPELSGRRFSGEEERLKSNEMGVSIRFPPFGQ